MNSFAGEDSAGVTTSSSSSIRDRRVEATPERGLSATEETGEVMGDVEFVVVTRLGDRACRADRLGEDIMGDGRPLTPPRDDLVTREFLWPIEAIDLDFLRVPLTLAAGSIRLGILEGDPYVSLRPARLAKLML